MSGKYTMQYHRDTVHMKPPSVMSKGIVLSRVQQQYMDCRQIYFNKMFSFGYNHIKVLVTIQYRVSPLSGATAVDILTTIFFLSSRRYLDFRPMPTTYRLIRFS